MAEPLYKQTINLPKTSFPMKADLAKRELPIVQGWEKEGLYEAIRKARMGKPTFLLHDGPPYANGNIHMGHALNKTLKDFIVKYKGLRGFDAPYVPGWDCHGLPVEHQLFKEMGKTKHQVDQLRFRQDAQRYAQRFVHLQRDQFKRLGIFGRWDKPYLTMDPAYEASIVESFLKLLKKGYIHQGTRPIHWCIHCETALAEAELEYRDHASPSVTVGFEALGDLGKVFKGMRSGRILIWTTTPWTLPANVAVAVQQDFQYSAVRLTGPTGRQEDWILASDLLLRNLGMLGINEYKVLGTVRGSKLEGIGYRHPFLNRQGKVVLSDFVTLEQGTGCVHIAPGHGQEDHEVGLRYGLEVLSPVNDDGVLTADAGAFAGLAVFKANPRIVQTLKDSGHLLHSDSLRHSYPHCWRCQNPVIFRATAQWFLRVDHQDLRKRSLEAVAATQWVPARGQNRMASMLETRPDWCLSRQRLWGVPIPAARCSNCSHPVMTPAMVQRFLDEVRGRGTEAWFKEDVSKWMGEEPPCEKCGGTHYHREHDILDVWFDSGVSHQAVLRNREDQSFPADLYLEGSDQHRGWFQSALLTSVPLEGKAPFACVLTHGFVTDGDGRKMSKSEGNVIAPSEIVEKYGADILRLWVSCVDYTDDVRISEAIVAQVADAYRKMRNTLRYLLGNLADFDPGKDAVRIEDCRAIDRWALKAVSRLVADCEKSYDAYEFYKVYRMVYQFCVVQMSSFYLDVLKDGLYTLGKRHRDRRSAQTALWEILKALTVVVSPVLAFTAEEVWALVREKDGALPKSVHLADWPKVPTSFSQWHEAEKWDELLRVREEVLKVLEEARQAKVIGSSLEAAVRIYAEDRKGLALLREHREALPGIFIVSAVEVLADKKQTQGLKPSAIMTGLHVGVERAKGAKCVRCWTYSTYVGTHARHPKLCERCVGVVEHFGNHVE